MSRWRGDRRRGTLSVLSNASVRLNLSWYIYILIYVC